MGADSSEVGQCRGNLLLRSTPGLDTRDNLLSELLVGTEAGGITV